MSFASVMASKSPTRWYRLNESSGTSAADSSGNGATATIVGSPSLAQSGLLTGDSDTCMDLNGSSQLVLVPASAGLDSSTAISGFARVRIDTTSNRYVMSRRDNASSGSWNFQIGAKLYVELFATGGYALAQSSTAPSTATTYSIGFTISGGLIKLYINGAQDGSSTAYSGSIVTNSAVSLPIGAWSQSLGGGSYAQYFDGKVDEVAYWAGTALSATDHSDLHTAAITTPSVTVSGEVAQVTTTARDGSAATGLTVSGEVAGVAVTARDGAIAAVPIVVTGEVATVTTTARDGSALTQVLVIGDVATLTATAYDGLVAGSPIPGEIAQVVVGALDGYVLSSVASDTSNALSGRTRGGRSSVEILAPVVTPPTPLATRVEKSVALPMPDLVNGRPT